MPAVKDSEAVFKASDKSLSNYREVGLWRCPASPHEAHHWLINSSGMSQCKYCGEKRQFANSKPLNYWYWGGVDREWYKKLTSEGWLRDILHVA